MHEQKVEVTLLHNNTQKTYQITPTTTGKNFHNSLSTILNIPKSQLSISYLNPKQEYINIQEDQIRTLEELGVLGQFKRVRVRDMGKQIRWDLVFYIEYLGPIVIIPLLYWFGKKEKYELVQHMAAIMGVTHFVKRELETRFVHVFSRKTMPLKRVFINSAHYWILFGFINSVELFLFPKHVKWDSNELVILFLIWAFMEFCNFKCHVQLSSFRKNDKKNRGIPKNWGFKYVSCANYLWETLGWLTFSIMTKCYSSFAFTAVSAAQMASWALKKHKAYKKQFGALYPQQRKAIFPYIL